MKKGVKNLCTFVQLWKYLLMIFRYHQVKNCWRTLARYLLLLSYNYFVLQLVAVEHMLMCFAKAHYCQCEELSFQFHSQINTNYVSTYFICLVQVFACLWLLLAVWLHFKRVLNRTLSTSIWDSSFFLSSSCNEAEEYWRPELSTWIKSCYS